MFQSVAWLQEKVTLFLLTTVPSFLRGMRARPSESKGIPWGQWAGVGRDTGGSRGLPVGDPGFCPQQLMKWDTEPIPTPEGKKHTCSSKLPYLMSFDWKFIGLGFTSESYTFCADWIWVPEAVRVEHLAFNTFFLQSWRHNNIPLLQPGFIQGISHYSSCPSLLHKLLQCVQRRSDSIHLSSGFEEYEMTVDVLQGCT